MLLFFWFNNVAPSTCIMIHWANYCVFITEYYKLIEYFIILACVNCVRWSFSGRFLASGGDDKLVMIWKISKYASGESIKCTVSGVVWDLKLYPN